MFLVLPRPEGADVGIEDWCLETASRMAHPSRTDERNEGPEGLSASWGTDKHGWTWLEPGFASRQAPSEEGPR